MAAKDKVEISEDRDANEMTVVVDTTGTGRAIADGVIAHIHSVLGEDLDDA